MTTGVTLENKLGDLTDLYLVIEFFFNWCPHFLLIYKSIPVSKDENPTTLQYLLLA